MIKISTSPEIKSYYSEILAFNSMSDFEIREWFKKPKNNPMLAYAMGYFLSQLSDISDTLSLYNTRFIQELEYLTDNDPFFSACNLTDGQVAHYIIDVNNIMDLNLSKLRVCKSRPKTNISFTTDNNEKVETNYFWNDTLKDMLTYHVIKDDKLMDVCTTRCDTLMSVIYSAIEPALTFELKTCDDRKYMNAIDELVCSAPNSGFSFPTIANTVEQSGRTALAYSLVKDNIKIKPLLLKYAAKKLKLDPVSLENKCGILFPILEDKSKGLFDVVTQIVNAMRQEKTESPADSLDLKLTFD